jgi:choline ABC transporter choline binding protein
VSLDSSSLNAHSKPPCRIPSCRPPTHRVKRAAALFFLILACALPRAFAAENAGTTEPASCRTVRLSDVGWTDVTSTTALVAELLRSIGYTPSVTVLSVPVTFASLKNKDIDVFLGNWMPAQTADRAPYDADGSVVVVGPNLFGAKYSLAVPAYTYAGGLKDFSDIRRFADALKSSIYGIEPGNDGNRLVLKMLKENQFALGDFKLIESSEQGMLAQVERAFRNKEPIVFLAWEPHPMNMRFDIKYLTGAMRFSARISAARPSTRTSARDTAPSVRTSDACSAISSSRCTARAR